MFISAAEKAKIFSTISALEGRIAELERKPAQVTPEGKPKRTMSEKHKNAIRAALQKRFAEKKAEKMAVGGTA